MKAHFAIVSDNPGQPLIIRDIGHTYTMSITNDAEEVVRGIFNLGLLPDNRRLLYYDSEGDLAELAHENGRFQGFKPVPKIAATYPAIVIQFMMPTGRQVERTTELPIETIEAYHDMHKHGCRFEAEMLMTGQVSSTISHPGQEADVDIEITPNGPEVQAGMMAILKRGQWKGLPTV